MAENSQRIKHGKTGRWKSAFVAGALVLGMTPGFALAAAGSAAADTGATYAGPGTQGTAAPQPHAAKPSKGSPLAPTDDSGMTAAQKTALLQAQKKAATTGKPVAVDALTDETSTTTANPSGTLTRSSTLLPTRVRKKGDWAPVDATLVRNADGTYSPKTSSSPLRLSGGGTSAPLVVMGSGATRLSFGWPAKLPAPTVSGAALTYPEVLPGVDLKLTATAIGGFSEVLVVKSASAAANPALKTLTLATHATGLTVRKDGQQDLDAVAPNGAIAFSASRPIMWDSAKAAGANSPMAVPSGTAAAAADPVATGAVPTPGAHVAYVGTRLGTGSLALTPDRKLLTGPNTVYPLYIDPNWNPHPASGSRQHFNEVQQACPTTTGTYDSTQYGDPGVGNNTYSGCVGLERSYFQLSVPSVVLHSHIVSAKINVTETYAAQCDTTSTINMYLTSAINSPFAWNNRPTPGTFIDSASFAPACTSYVSNSFEATSIMARAANGGWSSLAYVLINGNESSGYHFKRFAANPTMNITYNHVPNLPTSLALKLNSSTYNCATTTPYPILGKTIATTPPVLTSVVSDPDKDALQAKYAYWVGSATASLMYSADVSSGQHAPATFPAGYITGLADGSVVNWRVSVSDGEDSNGDTSTTCHFIVDRRAPVEPTVTSNSNLYPDIDRDGGPGAAAGTPGTFTAQVDPGTTNNNATKFVFGLDAAPPTTGAPASQTVTAVSNTASYKATPVAPGTHTLYAYALDEAGNESPMHEYHFTAVGHAGKTYASLSAAFDNTAVSSDSAMTAADADGVGSSYSLQDLQAAGWQPGGKITVDGATFTLPNFGSGSADNVLAANQTITMNGQQGNALVFLATSTYGGSASDHLPSDHSSPYVPDGTDVSATDCEFEDSRYSDCSEASGTVAFGDGTTQSYYLAVPDWHAGPFGVQVLSFPHTNSPSGQTAVAQRMYAFAVPLPPGASVSSVTLPDLSDTARAHVPGLHVFGMAVRDTTTAPGGAKWTGAWESPSETGSYNFIGGANYGDQTFRLAVRPSVSGSSVRVKLSNVGGVAPLTIDHATFAPQASGAAPSGTPTDLAFGGSRSVIVPVGGVAYSDPLTTPVTANQPVLVSFHLANSVQYIPEHTWASAAVNYMSPAGSGDHTADTASAVFTGSGAIYGEWSDIVTALDVTSVGNQPTIVTVGDDLIGYSSTDTQPVVGSPPNGATWRPANGLATALQSNTQGVPNYGVVGADIAQNQVAHDAVGFHGGSVDLLSRLDKDVLAEPDVMTVVVDQGLQDVVAGTDDTELTSAYQTLLDQLNAWGIRVVFTTLTPCDGYSACTAAVDDNRQAANIWVSDQLGTVGPGTTSVDADAAVAIDDPNSTATPPEQELSAQAAPLDFDSGDHVNLSIDGYQAVNQALAQDLTVLQPAKQ